MLPNCVYLIESIFFFFSSEVKSLLDGLLQRDIDKRLGCCGQGAEEVKIKIIKTPSSGRKLKF